MTVSLCCEAVTKLKKAVVCVDSMKLNPTAFKKNKNSVAILRDIIIL